MCTRNQAEEILHSVYHACSPIFGRIHDAYLYGSYARGDFTPESDIDILLTVDLGQAEIAKHRNDVAKVTSRLSLEHDITVSVTVKPLEQFRHYGHHFLLRYRDIVKLADLLGHSSIETTRIYLVESGAEHQRQLERLGLVS